MGGDTSLTARYATALTSPALEFASIPCNSQEFHSPDLVAAREDIGQEAVRLARQVLGLAHLRSTPEVLNPNDVVEYACQTQTSGFALHLSSSVWPIRVDPYHLEQVLVQIFAFIRRDLPGRTSTWIESSNVTVAGEQAPPRWSSAGPHGSILVPVNHAEARTGEYVRLSLSASCRSFDPKLVDLFNPRANSVRHRRGNQLALAMAQELIQGQGGWIFCRMHPDAGIEIELYLPRWMEPFNPGLIAKGFLEGRTILFIEDQAVLRRIGTDLLESLGLRVLGAASVARATEYLLQPFPAVNLVLLDLTLPDDDGPALTEAIHRHASDVPLLLCATPLPTRAVAQAVARFGAAGFVTKPFTLKGLAQTLQAALLETHCDETLHATLGSYNSVTKKLA